MSCLDRFSSEISYKQNIMYFLKKAIANSWIFRLIAWYSS